MRGGLISGRLRLLHTRAFGVCARSTPWRGRGTAVDSTVAGMDSRVRNSLQFAVFSRTFALLAALLLAGCASVSVKTDYDTNADFRAYRSFEMTDGHLIVEGQLDDGNTLVKDRIVNAIKGELVGRGLQLVESGGDLLVTYVGGARTVTEIEASPGRAGFGPYWGRRGWWGPRYTEFWSRQYTKGTLVIDLIDAREKHLVWRAYAESDVKSPEGEAIIRKAVAKAFKDFPPKR
jgi:hypothetical protein